MKVTLPPTKFSNYINSLLNNGELERFNWKKWDTSIEWRMFKCGYSYGLEESNGLIKEALERGLKQYES
jgi:hypothetical protein